VAVAAAAVVLVLVLASILVTRTPQETAPTTGASGTPSTEGPTADASPSPSPSESPGGVQTAVTRLDDASAPFTLTVLGDSTGNDGDEWVANLARSIADEKGRPVTYCAWDAAAGRYSAPLTFGQGDAAPVTIWNGSAAGEGPDYSLANLPALAPSPSDVLVVNHGHNFVTPQQGAADEAALITATAARWQTAPAVAVTLQNPRLTDAAAQDANLAAVRELVVDSSYAVIDVASAFRAQPDLAALLQADGTHPDAAGQAIWVDTVRRALRI
jgi:hypothetical protein